MQLALSKGSAVLSIRQNSLNCCTLDYNIYYYYDAGYVQHYTRTYKQYKSCFLAQEDLMIASNGRNYY